MKKQHKISIALYKLHTKHLKYRIYNTKCEFWDLAD